MKFVFAILIIITILKWIYFIKKRNIKIKNFKASFICITLYEAIIVITVLVEKKISISSYAIFTFLLWLSSGIICAKKSVTFLNIMEKFYPSMMRNYNLSTDYKRKYDLLQKELDSMSENSIDVVKEAILQRKLIGPTIVMHIETIFLTIALLFPNYLK